MLKPTRKCSIVGCGKPVDARGWCATHYSRWRRTGDAGGSELLRKPLAPNCSVDECEGEPLAKGLCNAHYLRMKEFGDASYLHKGDCSFCRVEMATIHPRKHCSRVCERMTRTYGGSRPQTITCHRCGDAFSILSRTRTGQYKRVDSKMCPDCKRGRGTRHGFSVKAIVAIHGTTDCGICGGPVDIGLRRPNLMSPSIDHIVPYAHGGSNDPSNLQLAHLLCNHVKSDRAMA